MERSLRDKTPALRGHIYGCTDGSFAIYLFPNMRYRRPPPTAIVSLHPSKCYLRELPEVLRKFNSLPRAARMRSRVPSFKDGTRGSNPWRTRPGKTCEGILRETVRDLGLMRDLGLVTSVISTLPSLQKPPDSIALRLNTLPLVSLNGMS
jgi:hypothetical protein